MNNHNLKIFENSRLNKTHSRKSSSVSNIENSSSIKNSLNNNNTNNTKTITQYTFNQRKNSSEINLKNLKNHKTSHMNAEDSEYIIESTSKNITESQRYNSKGNNQTYIEQLESKIQVQAKRLSELTKYKFLCEKRIRQLNPNEDFPVTEETISRDVSNRIQNSQRDKYDILSEKYIKLLKEHNELIKRNNSSKNFNHDDNNSNVNIESYNKLKEKFNSLQKENEKIIELLKEETFATQEQKNIINLFEKAINNDFIKNGIINQYITPENIIDFTKLKNESENYRKELVLSQALVNSLKSEIEQLNKEKNDNEINKKSIGINSEPLDNYNKNIFNKYNEENNNTESLNYNEESVENENNNNNNIQNNLYLSENLSLKSTLNNQAQIISNLMNENLNLKQIVEEANSKLNEGLNINNDARERMKNLEKKLNIKGNELSQYEEKFSFFNDYISNLKSSLMKLQDLIYKYINVYNKMGNEDLNSLLTKSFSEGILKLQNKISQMNNVQKYNLDSESDIKIHELIADLLKVINNEFVIIYEKIFESNGYYNESNRKVEQLKSEINNNNHNIEAQKKNIEYLNVQLNDQILENNKLKELNDKANEKNSNIYKEIDKLKRQIRFLTKEKGNIISVSQILIRICNVTDSKLSKFIQEGISLCETILKLEEEKSQIEDKLELIKSNEQNINMLNENKELAMMVNKEQATLLQLQNEFDRKIEEKEKKLEEIKTELNSLYNSYFSYSIDKNISPIPEKSIKTVSNSDLNSNYINSTLNNVNINLEKENHQSQLTNYDNFNDNDFYFSNTDNKNTYIKYNSFKQNNFNPYNNLNINSNKNNGSKIINYQSNNMNGKYNFQYGPATNTGY